MKVMLIKVLKRNFVRQLTCQLRHTVFSNIPQTGFLIDLIYSSGNIGTKHQFILKFLKKVKFSFRPGVQNLRLFGHALILKYEL